VPKPTLTIPLEIDGARALRLLKQFEETGVQATGKVEEGAKGATSGFSDLASGLIGVQSGLGMVSQVFDVVKESMRDAAEYTRKVVQEFTTLREAIKQIAALQGKTPTTEFTVEQSRLSAQGGGILTPQEMATFQTSWLQYGSGYVSKPGHEGEGRIDQSTVNEIGPKLAAYAKSRDIKSDVAARLMAAIVQTMPEQSKGESYEDMFMKIMAIAETSKGSATVTVGQIAPLLAEGIGKGAPFGEGPEAILSAARLAAVESERGPEESFTYSRALVHALQQLHHKAGAEAALGITPGMDVEAKIRAISAMADKNKQTLEETLYPYVHDPIRGSGAFLTARNQGIGTGRRPGMFDEMRRADEAASRADIDPWMEQYKAGGQGAAEFVEAETKRHEVETGSAWAKIEAMKKEAAMRLSGQRNEFGQTPYQHLDYGDVFRYTAGQALGRGSRREQLEWEEAVRGVMQRTSEAGVPITQAERQQVGGESVGLLGMNRDIYLKRLVEIAEEHLKHVKGGNNPRTIVPQMPNPQVRH